MAVKGPSPLPYTLVAGVDLSEYQFGPIGVDANGKACLANDPSQFRGVLENKPKLNEHATVEFGPAVLKVRVGAAVTAGNYLTVQSGGWFIAGNKAIWNVSSWVNAGSKTGLVGQAFETVSSGGIATAFVFPAAMMINSL